MPTLHPIDIGSLLPAPPMDADDGPRSGPTLHPIDVNSLLPFDESAALSSFSEPHETAGIMDAKQAESFREELEAMRREEEARQKELEASFPTMPRLSMTESPDDLVRSDEVNPQFSTGEMVAAERRAKAAEAEKAKHDSPIQDDIGRLGIARATAMHDAMNGTPGKSIPAGKEDEYNDAFRYYEAAAKLFPKDEHFLGPLWKPGRTAATQTYLTKRLADEVPPKEREAMAEAVYDIAQAQPKHGHIRRVADAWARGFHSTAESIAKFFGKDSYNSLPLDKEMFVAQLREEAAAGDPNTPPSGPRGWIEKAAEMAPPQALAMGIAKGLGLPVNSWRGRAIGGLVWTATMYQDSYVDLVQEGFSRDQAKFGAALSSIVQAGIETVNMNPFLRETGAANQVSKKAVRSTIMRLLKEVALPYGKEVGEEGLQAAAHEIIKESFSGLKNAEAKEIATKSAMAMLESAGPLAVMMGTGMGARTAGIVSESGPPKPEGTPWWHDTFKPDPFYATTLGRANPERADALTAVAPEDLSPRRFAEIVGAQEDRVGTLDDRKAFQKAVGYVREIEQRLQAETATEAPEEPTKAPEAEQTESAASYAWTLPDDAPANAETAKAMIEGRPRDAASMAAMTPEELSRSAFATLTGTSRDKARTAKYRTSLQEAVKNEFARQETVRVQAEAERRGPDAQDEAVVQDGPQPQETAVEQPVATEEAVAPPESMLALRQRALAAGIRGVNAMNRQQLVDAIGTTPVATEQSESAPPAQQAALPAPPDYSRMTVAQLHKVAKDKGLKRVASLKKSELVRALQASPAAMLGTHLKAPPDAKTLDAMSANELHFTAANLGIRLGKQSSKAKTREKIEAYRRIAVSLADHPAATGSVEQRLLAEAEAAVLPERGMGVSMSPPQVMRGELATKTKAETPPIDFAYRKKETARARKAREGLKPFTAWEKTKFLVRDIRSLKRPQFYLPENDPFYAAANEHFRLLHEHSRYARSQVPLILNALMQPLTKAQYWLLSDKINYDGALREAIEHRSFRHGYKTTAEIAEIKRDIDEQYAKQPTVQKVHASRQALVREMVPRGVALHVIKPEALDNIENYAHQQVFEFARGQKKYGQGSSVVKERKEQTRGPLPERYDWNLDFLEAEADWMIDLSTRIENKLALLRLVGIYGDPAVQAAHPEVEYGYYSSIPGELHHSDVSVADTVQNEALAMVLDELSPQHRAAAVKALETEKYLLPVPIIRQLQATRAPQNHTWVRNAAAAMRDWINRRLLIWPDRIIGWMSRNLFTDVEAPIAGGAPGVFLRAPKATSVVWKHYRGYPDMPVNLRNCIRHGVMDSSFFSGEVGDLKKMPAFERFYDKKRGIPRPLKWAVEKGGRFAQGREAVLRYAAYEYYLDKINAGKLVNFGGAKAGVVRALIATMGPEVAAAHLSRNLLGDYGNLSVAGKWLKATGIPFWAWAEINIKRWPRFAINAALEAKLRAGGNPALQAFYTGYTFTRLFLPAAAIWAFNNLVMPDEEDDLGEDIRASFHIVCGRNEDGTVRALTNMSAIGDFGEWFGLSTAIRLFPKYMQNQLTLKDLLSETLINDPVNKAVQMTIPYAKGAAEMLTGQAYFPDVFNPRYQPRDEAVFSMLGLQEEYRHVRGVLEGSGARARPHLIARMVTNITDPRENALHTIYSARGRFYKQIGKDTPNVMARNEARNMRLAVARGDFDVFREAKAFYEKNGGDYKSFTSILDHLDPIAQKLNFEDEKRFVNEFLSPREREEYDVAVRYAADLRDNMRLYWYKDVFENGTEEEKRLLLAAIGKERKNLVATTERRFTVKMTKAQADELRDKKQKSRVELTEINDALSRLGVQ